MMDYTKGKWIVGITYSFGWPVYRLRDMDTGSEAEVQANAHLIAAAPLLVEALKDLLNKFATAGVMLGFSEEHLLSQVKDAQQALAKARGE